MSKKSKIISVIALILLVTTAVSYSQVPSSKVNINTATVEQLTEIPGVGEKTAQNIVEYRKLHGEFKTVDELLNVKGIGEKRLEKVKDQITVI